MGEPLDPQTYAEVQREARILAEDRAIVAEARYRVAQRRVHELETLVLLYRPHDADSASSNSGDSAEPRPFVRTTWNPADGPNPDVERQASPYSGVFQ